jgi:hypothetical protein
MRQLCISTMMGLLLVGSYSCSDASESEEQADGIGFSTHELVIGQTVEVFTQTLDTEADSHRLMFEGLFRNDLGDVENVLVGQSVLFDGQVELDGQDYQVLRLSRFGPFGNPFSDQNRPGTFEGTVTILSVSKDGQQTETQSSSNVELKVGPSIVIEEFQPIDAQCGNPALRALPGLAYRLQVRAVGIKPVRFIYQVDRINGAEGTVEYVHNFEAPVDADAIGDSEPIIFNQIQDNEQFYATGIRVIAEAADGQRVETALPMTVHRPLEVLLLSKRSEMAERYPPVPVSGCIPGSIGTRVRYRETKSESRQRSVSMTISGSWSSSNGTVNSESFQEGISNGESYSESLGGSTKEEERTQESFGVTYDNSEANRVNVTTSDGENWGWNRKEGESNTDYESRVNQLYGSGSVRNTVGVSGEGSVPGFAKVTGHASTSVGVKAGGAAAWDSGTSRTNSTNRGFGMDGTTSEAQGFGSTVTEGESQTMNGSFALSQARTRSFQDSNDRQNSRTWDFSGSASQSTLVTEGQSEAEQSTWSSSETFRTVRDFGGTIPRNRVGMFYRQTTRSVKRAEVRVYTQCGLAEHVGEIQLSEWQWAPDLAIGESCEDGLPPTALEPAICLIPPCG